MRILRFFDWRFVLSVAFMMLVASVVFSSWSTAQQRDRLIDQNQHAQAVAASERHEAARERRAILAGQRDLQRKYDGLLATNKALLVYLRAHGIAVPVDLIPAENSDSSTVHSDGRKANGSSSGGSASPQSAVPAPQQTKKANPPSKNGGQSPAHPKNHGAKNHGTKGGGSGKGAGHSKAHSKGHGRK